MQSASNLLDVGPFVVTFLCPADRLALRAANKEGRAVVDRAITTLTLTARKPLHQFVKFVNGVLSRGSRPAHLVLQHPDNLDGSCSLSGTAVADLLKAALAVLALFVKHQQTKPKQQQRLVPPPSLTHLTLRNVPCIKDLASAVRSAAPHLTYLDLAWRVDERYREVPGLCCLITTCAPHLTSLVFSSELRTMHEPLADAIETCSRLQHLKYSFKHPDHCPEDDFLTADEDEDSDDDAPRTVEEHTLVRLAEAMRALPSLRSLDINLEGGWETPSIVEAAIGSLTQLTSLTLVGPSDVAALRPLRNLVHLSLDGDEYRLADVQPLSRLTYLQLFNDVDFDGCTELPASLRELHLDRGLTPRKLLQLQQLAPSLARLSFDGRLVHEGTPPAAGADGAGGCWGRTFQFVELAASPRPAASTCSGIEELVQAVRVLHGRYDGSKGLNVCFSPGDRYLAGDGHVRLFAALRPLQLRELRLFDCMLEVEDVAALVEQLPELEGLSLRCETHPAAVALLARLTRLRSLTVMLLSGRGAAAWTADSVATALNVVVRGINDLQEARIGLGEYWSSIPSQRQLAVAIKEGVESMQQTLRQMGRNPTLVGMY